eukprot:535114-Amphidinium_carterae.2
MPLNESSGELVLRSGFFRPLSDTLQVLLQVCDHRPEPHCTALFSTKALNRDFTCACSACEQQRAEGEGGEGTMLECSRLQFTSTRGGKFLQLDAQLLAELNLLSPEERATAVDAILHGEVALGTQDGEDADAVTDSDASKAAHAQTVPSKCVHTMTERSGS